MIQLGKLVLLFASCSFVVTAFSPAAKRVVFHRSLLHGAATTMEPPTDTKTQDMLGFSDNDDDYGDLEYLIDSSESREMEDPFHILLMGSTFEKPKITVPYVSGSLTYVLDMPGEEANELSKFAREQGMSCLGESVVCAIVGGLCERTIICILTLLSFFLSFLLVLSFFIGTWPREECLTLGRQLQRRDLVCRVVPFVEGGQRGWQAKDTSDVGQTNQQV